MKDNINALNEINKGASMGIEAIDGLIDKITDNNFKEKLENQKNMYKKIMKKINKIYSKYDSENSATEINTFNKVMTWYGLELRTLTDSSDSKIAEILLQGTNMGIIEGRKIINNKSIEKDVLKIANEFVLIQEKCIEYLKSFL